MRVRCYAISQGEIYRRFTQHSGQLRVVGSVHFAVSDLSYDIVLHIAAIRVDSSSSLSQEHQQLAEII
jgi:hypothetical protein